ncbi:hypothetical protein K0M31_018916 [Melipona bicolor]|uniref:Uncharacterized protein n=1 Tax=Melipona bicolor TaxID=60889 RepID=A0AA40G4A4_9HYME|nr:hypothetical protein K0M31_018916 [Melipona bicolor]
MRSQILRCTAYGANLITGFANNGVYRALASNSQTIRERGVRDRTNTKVVRKNSCNFSIVSFAECPISEDGMERFACPTADRMGRYHCIDDHALCDGFIDCPTGEDEDRQACMFYKTVSLQLAFS